MPGKGGSGLDKVCTALLTAPPQYLAAAGRGHAGAKADFARAFDFRGLVQLFHE